MDIEQALAGISGFAGAEVVEALSDGPTNSSFLIERDGERFVLRLDKPAAVELGLDRENEEHVVNALAGAGLTPEPVRHDVSTGVLLRPWLQGSPWTARHFGERNHLRRLARLLRRLHAVEPVGKRFDPIGAARRYARKLGGPDAAELLRRAERLTVDLAGWPGRPALCHNDPVCHNIIEGETLYLIDWEYAAVGDRYFDLAVVLQHHGVSQTLSRLFLENYLDRNPRADELQHLQKHQEFYACLLTLWNQVTG